MLKDENFEFNIRTKTIFGAGTRVKLPVAMLKLGFKQPGVVIDAGVTGNCQVKEILNLLKKQFPGTLTWEYSLNAEPDYDSLDSYRNVFQQKENGNVDVIVGIGGGSCMDFSKGLATLMTNPGPAREYRGFPENINDPLPVVAIPTTAGTSSEVTFNAVFTDKPAGKKLGINTHKNFPVIALLDPEITLDCPRGVSLGSGMDALVHCLESFVARQANSLTKCFAKEAFTHIFNHLATVIKEPSNMEARAHLLLGAYLAGISLCNSGSGPSGALSYPLGVMFNVPHGIGGGLFIAHVVKHNVQNGFNGYAELYDCIDGAVQLPDLKAKSQAFVEKLFQLYQETEVPQKLSTFGFNGYDLPGFMQEVEKLQGAFDQNPVSFTAADAKKILEMML
ncbi:iron-containing alcohol dehydrogenase [Candidatus Riflebacteria bacterium]